MLSDTQAVEGVVSTVKIIGRRAPHIGWPLLSSRVVAQRAVASCKTKADRKAFTDMCTRFHSDRWA
eukprot:1749663-Alexandrium_andersonii.AAC.1